MSKPDDLLDLLRRHDGAAPALTLLTGLHEEFRWTYRQLLQHTLGFRRALEAAGAGQGSTLCLIAGNCPQFIALFLACVDLGVTFVPVHPDQSAMTLTRMLRELRNPLVIVDEDIHGATLRQVMRAATTVWRLRLHRTPWLRPILSTDAQRRFASDVTAPEASAGDEASSALMLHSSGSTGAPKVILYSRERLNVFLHWQRRLFAEFPDVGGGVTPSPRVNALPLAHFGGLSFVLQALIDGRLVHLPRAIAPLDYLRLALREQCQLLMLVPALYDALLRDATAVPPPAALRYCLTMGEAAPSQLIDRVQRKLCVRLYSAYGMSEGLSGFAVEADTPPDSCGRHLFGEVKLVDAGDPNADLTQGELWVRNATTFPCYRDAALNAAKFHDGWYRTGDRFRRDARGYYYFLGRVDAMCVVNGRNVYPAEMEQVFLQHPDVTDCMAAILTLNKGGARLGLLACLRADSRATPSSLIDWSLEHGALHAVPAWLVLGKGIPRNAAGKRDRLAVATILQEDYRRCARKVS